MKQEKFEGLEQVLQVFDALPTDLNEFETELFNTGKHEEIAAILDPTFEENEKKYDRLIKELSESGYKSTLDLDSAVRNKMGAVMSAMMTIGFVYGLRLAGLSSVEVSKKLGKLHW